MEKTKVTNLIKKYLLEIASRGGKNRDKNLTAARKKEIAMMGVAARNKNRKKLK